MTHRNMGICWVLSPKSLLIQSLERKPNHQPMPSTSPSIQKSMKVTTIPVSIVPGMIAQVDIIRGERTILEYFWQPVAKMKDTAFRE